MHELTVYDGLNEVRGKCLEHRCSTLSTTAYLAIKCKPKMEIIAAKSWSIDERSSGLTLHGPTHRGFPIVACSHLRDFLLSQPLNEFTCEH